jgi:alanyl-tRNA synthetase
LPQRHVDTGAGLERIVGILRGSPSLFACDTLTPLVDEVVRISGRKMLQNARDDVAMRIIADHSRSATFLLTDGVIPSNDNRGYVLRRIIRRAIRFAYLLGIDSNIMPMMAELVIRQHQQVYPELDASRGNVLAVLTREEAKFRETLTVGLGILESELSSLPRGERLSGQIAFMLHDTHGFPLEITSEIVAEHGRETDVAEFRQLMNEQRERGRASKARNLIDTQARDYQRILELFGSTEFVGRTEYSSHARVVEIIKAKDGAEIFLDITPFYAEQGGQVGDQGTLTFPERGFTFPVIDTTQPILGLYRHRVINVEGIEDLCVGDKVVAQIDILRREQITRNHTATHLVHWALREVLGDHVKQQGSLVDSERLRFDFSHFEPLSDSQIREVENLVNREVLTDVAVEQFETTKEEALANGAISLFGEKYGDRVRVVQAGSYSLELCGGTHVKMLGQIGLLKIVSEASIGSNLRRIEAVSGMGVLELIRKQNSEIQTLADQTGIPRHQLFDSLHGRLVELRAIRSENKVLSARLEKVIANSLVSQAQGKFLVEVVEDMEGDSLRCLTLDILNRTDLAAVVLGSVTSAGRPTVAAAVADGFTVPAGTLLDQVSNLIGGGHGKQAKVAVAGGVDASKLEEALNAVRSSLCALE